MDIYPLRFKPVYKDYIWGGERIIRTFHRPEPPGIYAESWEVSTRPEGMSVVANGPHAGRTLQELVDQLGAALLGSRVPGPAFPLLIKLIDAHERLSVQVHPSDESAARHGGEAKTEMWYVLDADPDARVYAGLQPGVTRKDFEAALRQTRVEAMLQTVPVQAGDAIFMPGGRVHALDAGSLILEVQQNSNTTYRLYDWGRVGHDGRPRETHIAQALRVISWTGTGDPKLTPRPLAAPPPNQRCEVANCPYFRMERILLREAVELQGDGGSFQIFFAARGAWRISWDGQAERVAPGVSVFVPAALPRLALAPLDRESELLRITVP